MTLDPASPPRFKKTSPGGEPFERAISPLTLAQLELLELVYALRVYSNAR